MKVLALDPGSHVTGWAFGDIEAPFAPLHENRIKSGVITAPRKADIHQRNMELVQKLSSLDGVIKIDMALLEAPPPFSYTRNNSRWSGKSLTWQSILTLTRTIGAMGAALQGIGIEVVEVEATVWKQGMTKAQAKALSGKADHNEADAVEMLKWWRRRGQYLPRTALTRGRR